MLERGSPCQAKSVTIDIDKPRVRHLRVAASSGIPANSECRDWTNTWVAYIVTFVKALSPICSIIGSMALSSWLVDAYVRGKGVVSYKIRDPRSFLAYKTWW